ncbi:DUF3604 domain-containing protein [Propionibacteriaceae bacterium Y2011]
MPASDSAPLDAGPYDGLSLYVGDIHNHCGISYGHGSLDDAFRNARLQLDFASVTGHAWWHDIPRDSAELAELVDYHDEGFARLESLWPEVTETTEAYNQEGEFASFLSFEWHSSQYGDHCVYYRDGKGPLLRSPNLARLQQDMRRLRRQGVALMAIPHHVGYRQGWRGANWTTFTNEFSPVVEIISMHGCGESDDAPRPYLHTMGPREGNNTAVRGLRDGLRFGFIGSTDHHSAHPGSHGYGRMAVWADELTRQSLWRAVHARHTYAITGDRIEMRTGLNDAIMGESTPATDRRTVWADVRGLDKIDYVEVLRNGEVIERVGTVANHPRDRFSGVVSLSVGWGEANRDRVWDVSIEVVDGELVSVEPRLHGHDVVAPTNHVPHSYCQSWWLRESSHRVQLHTRTSGNPNVLTDATQGLALRIVGHRSTTITVEVDGNRTTHTLAELRQASRVRYPGTVFGGAYKLHQAVPDEQCSQSFAFDDDRPSGTTDWYYVRARQVNDEWAWSSPIWVEGSGDRQSPTTAETTSSDAEG